MNNVMAVQATTVLTTVAHAKCIIICPSVQRPLQNICGICGELLL